jgi:hypothetical protein
MRLIIVLVLLAGVGGVALYYGGGYKSFDPSKQGEDAKAKITPGMSWTQVIDTCGGPPREYIVIVRETKKEGGVEQIFRKPGPKNPFKKETVERRVADGSLTDGFIFQYQFSSSVAFAVTFDAAGNVVDVGDMITMADLLDLKKH